jgi:hypothetical protein
MMRKLPDKTFNKERPAHGVRIKSSSDVSIDTLQGVATIESDDSVTISIGSAETLKLYVDAPRATVYLHVKSLHDSSFIKANKVCVSLSENSGVVLNPALEE